ncbi:MAG: 3'-5' exonuclease [Draconibacterium sp.]
MRFIINKIKHFIYIKNQIQENLFTIIDIETTGSVFKYGKITEIAIFQHNGQKITDSFSTLINPEIDIPQFITRLTGISNEMVKDAPKFYEVAKQIIELTEGRTFIAHNVNFDYSFIKEEYKRLGYIFNRKKLCTVQLSRKLLPGHSSYSLGKLCSDLGVIISDRHRAEGDALATVKLFEILLEKNRILGDSKTINNLKLF